VVWSREISGHKDLNLFLEKKVDFLSSSVLDCGMLNLGIILRLLVILLGAGWVSASRDNRCWSYSGPFLAELFLKL
jgi:hypothetical protein